MQQQALIIFIKNPKLGKAKTRIAQTAGYEKALLIYKELLKHTRKVACSVKAKRLLYYSEFIDQKDEWNADLFDKKLQHKGDLGTRMAQAFAEALNESEKAIIIGSDCASLTHHIVKAAFDALDVNDFVIGPAEDGGYYLLGMKQPDPTLFEAIEWSTSTVFMETIARIDALSKTYALLPTLSDIDYWEDWVEYGWEIKE